MDNEISVRELGEAFALAVKCSEKPGTPARERASFRKIAELMWKACGHGKEESTNG
jgi:hypothetical protein